MGKFSALDVRCSYAYGLVQEVVYGSDSEIFEETMEMVLYAAQSVGFDDCANGVTEPPEFFKDAPALLAEWRDGRLVHGLAFGTK